jgi:hypothetical protein
MEKPAASASAATAESFESSLREIMKGRPPGVFCADGCIQALIRGPRKSKLHIKQSYFYIAHIVGICCFGAHDAAYLFSESRRATWDRPDHVAKDLPATGCGRRNSETTIVSKASDWKLTVERLFPSLVPQLYKRKTELFTCERADDRNPPFAAGDPDDGSPPQDIGPGDVA